MLFQNPANHIHSGCRDSRTGWLTGARRISVAVSGDADGVEAVVRAVPGVTRVTSREDGKLEFETLPGADPRPEVARALVQAGYYLLEMHAIGVSLEDIFLQLTRDEPSPLEPAEDDLLDRDLPE